MTEQIIPVGNDYTYTHEYTKKQDEILIISQNVRSNNTNGNKLKDLILETDADIIGIQETWNKDIFIDGYKTLSNHRKTRGGGVSILTKQQLNFQTEDTLTNKDIELISIKSESFKIINIYRPPSGNIANLISTLEMFIQKSDTSKLMITGDFNINFNISTKHSTNLVNTLLNYNLINSTSNSTRHTDHGSTRIDAIFVQPLLIKDTGILMTDISDHMTPFISIANKPNNVNQCKEILHRQLDKNTIKLATKKLSLLDLDTMNTMTVDESYTYLTDSIRITLDELAPLRPKQVKKGKKITNRWMTKGLIKSSKHKNKLLSKWLKNKTAENKQKFKIYKKIYERLIDESKYHYCNNYYKKNFHNPRMLWDKTKEFMGNRKIKECGVGLFPALLGRASLVINN